MNRATWDEVWLDVASTVSRRSACSRRRVGAVIVTPDNRLISSGYNGPPLGFKREDGRQGCADGWCPRGVSDDATSDYGNCVTIHAEANALLFADRNAYAGGTIYVTSSICWECAKLVANSGVNRVVVNVWKADAHRNPEKVHQFMRDCGLVVVERKLG